MAEKNYAVVESLDELQYFADRLITDNTAFGFDIETGYDGPDRYKASVHTEENFIVGFSFTNSTKWARYVPLRHDYCSQNLDPEAAAKIFWPVLNSGNMVCHNVRFELRNLAPFFRQFVPEAASSNGYVPFLSDSMLEAYVLGQYRYVGLKPLTLEVHGHKMIELAELFEEGFKKDYIRFNPLALTQQVVTYACEDALWSLVNHETHYQRALTERSFVFKEELLTVPILCRMEDFGLQMDWGMLMRKSTEAKDFLAAQNAEIHRMLEEKLKKPYSINLGSSQQVSKLLYEELGFTTNRMTKGSKDSAEPKMSTDAVALERLSRSEAIVKKIVQWREIKKLIGSYLDKYVREYNYDPETGRAHPSHNQTAVVTGRFSVSDPNYQQLPKHYVYELDDGTAFNLEFRKCVISPEGYYLAGLDFSQIEIRVMAGESQEESLMAAFANGIDIHAQVGAIVLGIPVEEMTEEQRDKYGKVTNLAVGYGLGEKAMADRLAISEEEAVEIMDQYFERVPKLKAFIDAQKVKGRRDGFVVNRFGRKMTIWDYQSDKRWIREKGDRAAFNYIIQSAGTGDLTKIAMIRADQAIKDAELQDKIHLVMNVHDELNFYVSNDVDFETEFVPLISKAVAVEIDGWPKVEAEWHRGQNWGELTEYVMLSDGKLMEKKAFKAIKAAKASELKARVSSVGGKVVVEVFRMPTKAQFGQFVSLVKTNPGPHTLILKTPNGILPLPDFTSVGPDMHETVSGLLGGAEVSFESSRTILDETVPF